MSDDLVSRLHDEAMRLSGQSIDRGCVDSGIASNLADAAADALSEARAEIVSLRTELGETQLVLEQTEKNAERKLDELRANIATLRARVREVVGIYSHDGHLQTLESREAFRAAAKKLMEAVEP